MNKILEQLCLGMSGIFILFILGFFGFAFSYIVLEKIVYIGLASLIIFGIISIIGIIALIVGGVVVYTFGAFIDVSLTKVKQ